MIRSKPLSTLQAAVMLARGLEGYMHPHPDSAGPEHAVALLSLAAAVQEADADGAAS